MWQPLKQQLWEWRGVLITTPVVAGIAIAFRLLGWLQPYELAALDQYFCWRPKEATDERIVIVAMSEADLKRARRWPISDRMLAQVLEKIKAQNPAAIGLDLYRDFPVEPGHGDLLRVFESTPNLVGIELINQDNPDNSVAPPPILSERGLVGANNVVNDMDGILRRSLLTLKVNDGVQPSFSMLLAGIYLESKNLFPEPLQQDPRIFQWGKAKFRPLASNDGGYVGIDDGGYQIFLNYRGPAGTFPMVTMTDVLEDNIPDDLINDSIVLIGATAVSLHDFFYTAYSNDTTMRESTTGVEVQANMVSQIISAVENGRPLLKTWSEPVEILWIVGWSFVGATLTWKWRYLGGLGGLSLRRTAITVVATGALFGSTYGAFLGGWWLPVIPPLLALSGSAIAITAYIASTAIEIRHTFGRYLTDQVVADLLENPDKQKLGGENRKITILTSDLRGFTAISERLHPQEVVKILNIYLGHMADVITAYQGTIDEFMGDGILVLFGALTLQEDDAHRAVACALAMQLAMTSVNEEIEQLGYPKLEMGIGINTGVVVLGNIGSEKRTKYSVIGSAVNLAYRIESYTTGGQVMISPSTLEETGELLRIDGQQQVKPKGIKQPITIYEVGGIGDNYNLFLPKQQETFFEVNQKTKLQFNYAFIDGKHISNLVYTGRLVEISNKGAKLRANSSEISAIPEPLSNIKLNLLDPDNVNQPSEDIYAKVLEKTAEPGIFYIRLTAVPPEISAKLESLYQSVIRNCS